MENDHTNKLLKPKPEFNYDTEIKIFDLIKNPELILEKLEGAVILCHNCSKPLTIRFRKNYITLKCACGVRIFYPKGEKNYYDSRFIDAQTFYKNLKQNKF